ncbi:hypothetical protein EJF18_70307 [Clavispora lusitaniae]|uniref:Uncharacterized protein n=1 Tax=Clavispora lusitaniae TaxID=36911 RepID=A0ACD0WRT7_CLALS|nr:hypothetical protein EJF14_70307 [Clavispora lusitaniae]QFZ35893.1 hypothetical protein EJF16_70307 [Clavispora lusitaniae]QFZ41575.1 hypothetical protein EJF15_70307 [Clavispora lusitaniae]QFZ47253.1 hypothetical protein EJF18_70307 [Clavispora lusitaniae]QFZ52930.1 hypothetical protein EJF17_70307 [Clavispora lusitaniae]
MSGGLRLVAVSDIQGNWDALDLIAGQHKAGAIIHTGNFGFWNSGTVGRASDVGYLKQIVAFSDVLPQKTVLALNNLSTINGSAAHKSGDKPVESPDFKDELAKVESLSHMDKYISGEKTLPCPVYTIVGPLDDPVIVEEVMCGAVDIPNLHIVSHDQAYTLKVSENGPDVQLYGLGGNLKVHSLFDNGSVDGRLCGKVGDLWITLAQVAHLFLNHQSLQENGPSIKIFMSHSPVIKTPLLEHLAIITGADFTISQGLHFKYPVSGNGMSFVDSMGGSAGYIENYRSKFSRLRMILGELWLVIKDDVNRILAADTEMRNLIELGLSLFDKIPVTIGDSTESIVKLTLGAAEEENADDMEVSKLSLKKINDMYFSAYYNLWHFNLCDHMINTGMSDRQAVDLEEMSDEREEEPTEFNVMVFSLSPKGNFRLVHCNSQGFNFQVPKATPGTETETSGNSSDEGTVRAQEYSPEYDGEAKTDRSDDIRRTKELLNSTYKDYRARGRGRGRGARGARGGKRGRPAR